MEFRLRKIRFLGLALVGFLAGCADESVRVYSVPKEEYLASLSARPASPAAPATPHLHWELPAGWVEMKPERLKVASFAVRGEDGKVAEVGITPFPGMSGIELDTVNMWRKDLDLEPLTDLGANGEEVVVGGKPGRLYEIAAQAPKAGAPFKSRTMGVIHQRDNILWFVKMTGEESLVAGQKENFTKFVRSLEFHGADAHGGHAPPPAVSANAGELPPTAGQPDWHPPANWQMKAPGPMVLAAFAVTNAHGAGELTITRLAGEGGGLEANVNRWRGQLGLGPASAAEIAQSVSRVTIDGKEAPLVDLAGTNARSGQPARMLTLLMRAGSDTWFYKLMGPEAVVNAERENLVKFVEEAH